MTRDLRGYVEVKWLNGWYPIVQLHPWIVRHPKQEEFLSDNGKPTESAEVFEEFYRISDVDLDEAEAATDSVNRMSGEEFVEVVLEHSNDVHHTWIVIATLVQCLRSFHDVRVLWWLDGHAYN